MSKEKLYEEKIQKRIKHLLSEHDEIDDRIRDLKREREILDDQINWLNVLLSEVSKAKMTSALITGAQKLPKKTKKIVGSV